MAFFAQAILAVKRFSARVSLLARRQFLKLAGGSATLTLLPPWLRTALAVPAAVRTGTIKDVQHVVILMQENRSFDQYFGTLRGVRGFGDRMTIPLPDDRTVWQQKDATGIEVWPYHLDGQRGNAQRVESVPHNWTDAQQAWDHGRTGHWPQFKKRPSMSYYTERELPFQFALANAFTVCDAYHCSIQGSTNPNRLFMFSGTNGPGGVGGGPAIDNANDDLGPPETGFSWTTYPERLEQAGVSWKLYQDMADNFTDNSLEGFRSFREAYQRGGDSPLMKGLTSTLSNSNLDGLKQDVLSGALPQVSWIIAPEAYSEHAEPSSPVQGGWYTQQVIEALTSNPAVWSQTVLLVMFDENDGFFDHVPPPAAPSLDAAGRKAGASTVDDARERHVDGSIYGPGPRVPMYVISPWSRGGWVNSQVFDHTSIIRFLEQRFGVAEPNISAWRRAVCGDLTSAFDFKNPNDDSRFELPQSSREQADRHRREQEQLAQIEAFTGSVGTRPRQETGVRPSRALPYQLQVDASCSVDARQVQLRFGNTGTAAAVFQVYDRLNLSELPRRYTVESGKSLSDVWRTEPLGGRYDLWVLGPNGFHRHFQGDLYAWQAAAAAAPEVEIRDDAASGSVVLRMRNSGASACVFSVVATAYDDRIDEGYRLDAGATVEARWPLEASGYWYDFTVSADVAGSFIRRFAGRLETGRHSISDPAMNA